MSENLLQMAWQMVLTQASNGQVPSTETESTLLKTYSVLKHIQDTEFEKSGKTTTVRLHLPTTDTFDRPECKLPKSDAPGNVPGKIQSDGVHNDEGYGIKGATRSLNDISANGGAGFDWVEADKPRTVFKLPIPCPVCGKTNELTRIHRRVWMRLFIGSRYYKCECCSHRFLFVLKHCILRYSS